jgi:hypothetical protein
MAEVTPLVNRAIQTLDEISAEIKIDLARLRKDADYFSNLYYTLKRNLDELKELKDEMELRGFDSPYFALGMGRYGSPIEKGGYKREDIEDQRDVARHKMFFRANASLKKGTFERTKSAIASHNIAVGHLEEFVQLVCNRCGREAKGKDATRIIEETGRYICQKCNSKNISIKENDLGIFRLEILPHLPYGGEFTLEISKFTPTERMAYRDLIEVLREKKKGRIKSATVTFRAPENGKWIIKKEQVTVRKGKKLDYETILREKYGRIVIEHIRYHHERSILVSGRYNRQVLAIAYTKILKEKRSEILDYLLSKKVDLNKLKKYEHLREKMESRMAGVISPSVSLDFRITEERRELMLEFEEELKKIGLMDEYGNLDPELEMAVEYRQKIRKDTLIKIPRTLFAWDIFRFLLIKPYRERRYASIFPGLQPVPEKEQLESALEILSDEEIISAVGRFIDEHVILVKDAPKVVFKKFEIEEILQDYLKVTSSRAVGGIALYLMSDLPLEVAARVVNSEVEELKEVLKVIIRLGRRDVIPLEKLEGLEEIKKIKISDKAKQFLDLVR